MLRLFRQGQDSLLPAGKALGAVQHHQGKAGLLCRRHGPVHAQLLHAVARFPDACGVAQPQKLAAEADLFLQGVPGGAGHLGDDGPVIAQQGVKQRRFPGVGQAQQHRGDAPFQNAAPAEGVQQPLKLPAAAGEGIGYLPMLRRLNVLVGVVHRRIKAGGDVHEVAVHPLHAPTQCPGELEGGVLGGLGGFGVNEVRHCLRLNQVHPPAEKGPLGKLPAPGLPGPGGKGAAQHLVQHHRGAVAVQLRRPLAGIAALRRKQDA